MEIPVVVGSVVVAVVVKENKFSKRDKGVSLSISNSKCEKEIARISSCSLLGSLSNFCLGRDPRKKGWGGVTHPILKS